MKVMVIGDVHVPYVHPNYLKFLKDQRNKEKPDMVVQIGDLVDHYTLSRFAKDPEAETAYPEWESAMKFLDKFYKAFPEVTWIRGNHDNRLPRSAAASNIHPVYLRDLKDIYNCPKKWEVCFDKIIDNVMYNHEGGTSESSWQNHCYGMGMSTVSGHTHTIAGYRFNTLPSGQTLFSMKTGSGVDSRALAFAYGKANRRQPVLSCGFVTDGYQPYVAIMNMDERKYRRIR